MPWVWQNQPTNQTTKNKNKTNNLQMLGLKIKKQLENTGKEHKNRDL